MGLMGLVRGRFARLHSSRPARCSQALPSPQVTAPATQRPSLSLARPRGHRDAFPSLRLPLSTLRLRPHGRRRMTRGHRGSLLLRCRTFSGPFSKPAYPGAPQFTTIIDELTARYGALADPAGLSVVFDAGQNSEANFAHLDASGLGWVGSLPPIERHVGRGRSRRGGTSRRGWLPAIVCGAMVARNQVRAGHGRGNGPGLMVIVTPRVGGICWAAG